MQIFVKEGELVKIAARSDQRQTRVLLLVGNLLISYLDIAIILVNANIVSKFLTHDCIHNV